MEIASTATQNQLERDPVLELAYQHFGINYLYPYQRFVIGAILDAMAVKDSSKDTDKTVYQLVLLPTGAGKSLCFQLPTLLCPKPSLVIFPLLGLISDQQRRLISGNISSAVLHGGMSAEDRDKIFCGLSDGSIRVLLTNPESLAIPSNLSKLKGIAFSHCIIDEAHCVAEWGDSFRPAYLELGRIIGQLSPGMVSAFTATASKPIIERMTDILFGGRQYSLVLGNPDRPNLRYEVHRGLSQLHLLRQTVKDSAKPLIIFVSSRSGAEICARRLITDFGHLPIRFYHAGLDKSEKAKIEDWFLRSDNGILCATCAYGMGMDKPNIRTVIHLDVPGSVEAYLQEAGRAGRDGQPAKAVLLRPEGCDSNPGSASEQEQRAGLPNIDLIRRQRQSSMLSYAAQSEICRRSYLLKSLDMEDQACSGCDICSPDSRSAENTTIFFQAFFKRHNRRFTKQQAINYLGGKDSAAYLSDYGILSNWIQDEIVQAIEASLQGSWLEEGKRGLWRGRLLVRKRKSTKPDLYSSASSSRTARRRVSLD